MAYFPTDAARKCKHGKVTAGYHLMKGEPLSAAFDFLDAQPGDVVYFGNDPVTIQFCERCEIEARPLTMFAYIDRGQQTPKEFVQGMVAIGQEILSGNLDLDAFVMYGDDVDNMRKLVTDRLVNEE